MRIKFSPIQPESKDKLFKIAADNDLVAMLNPSKKLYFDNLTIYDEQQYTDYSRYQLNIFKAKFERCYKLESEVDSTNVRSGFIQVISVDLNFDMGFDFRLLDPTFVNYWNNDTDIDFIKPNIKAISSAEVGYFAFRSLATSFFAKALSLIDSTNILCFKRGNRIVLAYNLLNNETANRLDDILDNFLNGIYQMVKVTSERMNYDIPPENGNVINLQNWYQDRLISKNPKQKKKYYYYKY